MQSPYAVDPLQRGRVSISLNTPETRPATSDLTLSLLLVKSLLAISVHAVRTWLLSSNGFGEDESSATSVSTLNAAFLLLGAIASALLPQSSSSVLPSKDKPATNKHADSPLSILSQGLAVVCEWAAFWYAIQQLPVFK